MLDMMQVPGGDNATLNVALQGGDIINVPDGARNRIFVLGEVNTPAMVHSPNIAGAVLLSTEFRLQPLDVVYVSASTSTSFGRVLEQVLPTLHAIYILDQTMR
ncbi:polysaccharide biosynthesis/export family protein [Paraburkholderia caledonica]|uniref:Uncharacterized protein n=1 Tax=Paraburkholderia caledonica TaxID=134536 RepID=A0AB73IM55_9BURK|nr:hypothetical protein [Paraburkholderia caledonica]